MRTTADTRDKNLKASSAQAILNGLAPDGELLKKINGFIHFFFGAVLLVK